MMNYIRIFVQYVVLIWLLSAGFSRSLALMVTSYLCLSDIKMVNLIWKNKEFNFNNKGFVHNNRNDGISLRM